MKVAERVIEKEGTLDGERVGMTIDMGALAHIMSVLTDLYSDPEMAVIREYSTNALDAHVAAGITDPIEVTLPTPLSPFLRIRDYGTGLDADDIRDIYSRYGTSTKRDSDEVVGMLGLGCKSGLTYADQFTLTGIKGGVMTQVQIGRDEDGAGSMTIVAQHPTDDRSGVEVTIPAKRQNALESKARDFFRFWTPGTVLVNGEHPKRIDGMWLTDRLLVTTECDQHGVVMGNVFYPLRTQYRGMVEDVEAWPTFDRHTRRGIAFVDIGEVNFTPSREALQMTPRTKETLERLAGEFQDTLDESCRRLIEQAATAKEALAAYREATAIGLKGTATYQGREITRDLIRTDATRAADGRRYLQNERNGWLFAVSQKGYRNGRLTGEWTDRIELVSRYSYHDDAGTRVIIENFDGAGVTPVKREKIALYLRQNSVPDASTGWWILSQGPLSDDERFWLSGNPILDWNTIKEVVLPKDGTTKRQVVGTYNVSKPGSAQQVSAGRSYRETTTAQASEIPQTKGSVVWLNGNQWDARGVPTNYRGLIPDDVWVVALPANRVEKFKRDFPNAQYAKDYANDAAAKKMAALDPDDVLAARFQAEHGKQYVSWLPLDQVDDPRIHEWHRLTTKPVDAVRSVLHSLDGWGLTSQKPVGDPLYENYPLCPDRYNSRRANLEHTVLYLNAAYAAFHKEDA